MLVTGRPVGRYWLPLRRAIRGAVDLAEPHVIKPALDLCSPIEVVVDHQTDSQPFAELDVEAPSPFPCRITRLSQGVNGRADHAESHGPGVKSSRVVELKVRLIRPGDLVLESQPTTLTSYVDDGPARHIVEIGIDDEPR